MIRVDWRRLMFTASVSVRRKITRYENKIKRLVLNEASVTRHPVPEDHFCFEWAKGFFFLAILNKDRAVLFTAAVNRPAPRCSLAPLSQGKQWRNVLTLGGSAYWGNSGRPRSGQDISNPYQNCGSSKEAEIWVLQTMEKPCKEGFFSNPFWRGKSFMSFASLSFSELTSFWSPGIV